MRSIHSQSSSREIFFNGQGVGTDRTFLQKVGMTSVLTGSILGFNGKTFIGEASAQTISHPKCESDFSDPDGDGYGWENNQSCKVIPGSVHTHQTANANSVSTNEVICQSASSDSDGDGWGWENGESCKVVQASVDIEDQQLSNSGVSGNPICQFPESDAHIDGYGWENGQSCRVENSTRPENPSINNLSGEINKIRDRIIVAGQSNGLGPDTQTNGKGDSPRQDLFAQQRDGSWKIADQCNQIWWTDNEGKNYPMRYRCNISLAHEIGEGLLERDSGTTVGVTSTGQPGQRIELWDDGTQTYRNLISHIKKGIPSDAYGNPNFKLFISWHHGESNHGNDKNWYKGKVDNLIQRFRRDLGVKVIFIGNSSPFIPSNNSQFHSSDFGGSMNSVYRILSSDGDPDTCFVDLSNLATKDGTHFTADSNDIAGRRVANLIHSIKNGGSNAQCD